MNNEKYIAFDMHQATISVAVRDAKGKLVMESILETKAATILEFLPDCVAACSSPSKKEPGRLGSTICLSRNHVPRQIHVGPRGMHYLLFPHPGHQEEFVP